jgi:Rap1a immunity proteins
MSYRILIAAVATTLVSFGAYAAGEEVSANQWSAHCSSRNAELAMSCMDYTRGLADGIMVSRQAIPADTLACIPAGVSTKQLVDVGQQYLTGHPEIRRLPIAELLFPAFKEAWPCKMK